MKHAPNVLHDLELQVLMSCYEHAVPMTSAHYTNLYPTWFSFKSIRVNKPFIAGCWAWLGQGQV